MLQEKVIKVQSGYTMLVILLLGMVAIGASIYALVTEMPAFIVVPALITSGLFTFIMSFGFFIVNPNESKVLILFGDYKGTVKDYGFHWANPFYTKRAISLRARNLNGDKIKVNDQIGNPIIIAAVVVWKVMDTAKAAFEVNDYEHYVNVQSEAAVRNLAGSYSYDNFDDEGNEITLRSGGAVVNDMLEKELTERLQAAGIEIIEARIAHLAYASEIAGAMLQRQQATAVVAARFKIVEGAVSMVEMALDELNEKDIVEFDEEKKAAMVSNLMVVLCSDKAASPIVNAGTLHH